MSLAFLFAEAANQGAPIAAEVMAESFPALHRATIDSSLPEQAWRLIARSAPQRHGREWDRAERLRDALVRSFTRYQWDKAFFVKALQDREALVYTVRQCVQTEEGRVLLRACRSAIRNNGVEVTPYQREIFENAARKKIPEALWELFERILG